MSGLNVKYLLWPAALCAVGYCLFKVLNLQREMKAKEQRLALVLAGGKVGFWDWSVNGHTVVRNRGYAALLGYTTPELTDQLIFTSELIHPDDAPRLERALADYLSGRTEQYEIAYRLRDNQGKWRWVLDRGVVTDYDRSGRPVRMVGITIDIHSQKTAELRLEELTYTDPVTGLYNRAYFDKALRELDRPDALPLSIILGDLNDLKLTNDTFGHAAGDDLLVTMADVLRATCRKSDIITRWGGDEFAIILPNTTEADALKVCSRIRAACAAVHDSPIKLSIALGVSTRTTMGEPMSRVIRTAEQWMYQHKLAESDSITNALVLSISDALETKYQDGVERGARQETLAIKLGRALGLSHQELADLALLARMHDVGHVLTKEEILSRPSPRSSEEEQIYQQHVESGYRVARALPQLRPIAETILAHHEHWDGSGYPRGLAGEDIPLLARIMAVVDAFDDLRQGRTPLGPLSAEEALAELAKHAGTKFEPKLVEVFREIMQETRE